MAFVIPKELQRRDGPREMCVDCLDGMTIGMIFEVYPPQQVPTYRLYGQIIRIRWPAVHRRRLNARRILDLEVIRAGRLPRSWTPMVYSQYPVDAIRRDWKHAMKHGIAPGFLRANLEVWMDRPVV